MTWPRGSQSPLALGLGRREREESEASWGAGSQRCRAVVQLLGGWRVDLWVFSFSAAALR